VTLDRQAPLHPRAIATTRAHRRTPTCPARGNKAPGPCTCTPDPDDLAEVWAGRARMARARQAAGRPLNRLDREALDHHQEMTT
jgi:hypothetical protein